MILYFCNLYLYLHLPQVIKSIVHIVCFTVFTFTRAMAQMPDSSLLQDQNPNHQRSKDKYTKPVTNPVKEKPPVLPADTVKPSATATPTMTKPSNKQEIYLKNLKKAEESFVAKGNYKDAYEISLLLKQANDSLAKNEARQHLLQEKLRYDSLHQIEKNKTYQRDLFQKQTEVESSRKIVYLAIAALALALLLALAFYRKGRWRVL